MTDRDVAASELVWHEANIEARARFHLPLGERTEEGAASFARRIGYLLRTDPQGAWVAEHEGRVVGLAQALVRDGLWVLSLFAVLPDVQRAGLGRRLLDASLACGDGLPGMILCSRDPVAMRRYTLAGFDLNPAVVVWGRPSVPGAQPGVRTGGPGDLPLVNEIASKVRGAGYGGDIGAFLAEGAELLLFEDRGYAITRGGLVMPLGATDEEAATALLRTGWSRAVEREAEAGWITGHQQWAIRAALEAGLEIIPLGPVMTRGMPMPVPYLPSGAYG